MTVLAFLKAPVPGRVKTRLAPALGPRGAAEAYRRMAGAVASELQRLRGHRVVWVYDAHPDFPDLAWLALDSAEIWPQAAGDLGERLAAAFERAFREGGGSVCAVGMDSPGLPAERFREARDALGAADVVLGPAEDGGYYLIGLAAWRPELFQDIPWSTDRTLSETLRRAETLGLKVALLPPYFDVDTPADYERWTAGS